MRKCNGWQRAGASQQIVARDAGESRQPGLCNSHGACPSHPDRRRRSRNPRSLVPFPGETRASRHRCAGSAGGAARLATWPLSPGDPGPDAAGGVGPGFRALAAQPVRCPDRDADRHGRGDGPHRGAGAGCRRLCRQALQPARAAGPHPRRAAPCLGRRRGTQGPAAQGGALRRLDAGARPAPPARPFRHRGLPDRRRVRASDRAGGAAEPRADPGHADGPAARAAGRALRPGDRRGGVPAAAQAGG
ncbi:hypothetical protein ROTAS13_04697 [Roseomonas sp. TAS13]|nr:hypothetical protein ROTAS13_04697 [Roseomonas sp. TAS13]